MSKVRGEMQRLDRPRSRTSRSLTFIFKSLCTVLVLAATTIASLWLVGRVLTDRYSWSQWLWWIPTLVALLCAIVALTFVFSAFGSRKLRRAIAIAWIVIGATMFMYFAVIEHRLMRREVQVPASPPTLKVAHWNVQPPTWAEVEPSVRLVQGIDADVNILTDPGGLLQHEQSQTFIQEGFQIASAYPFALISRVPVLSMRTVVHVDRLHLIVAELDTTQSFGQPISLYLVDLPSRPSTPRMEVARRLRGMIDNMSLPAPDMVVGDFNIPRGSASITTLFPNMRHVFNEAGHGYGATYPRTSPYWHIDHILLSESLRAIRYDIIDPGRSRHRMQVAWIAAAP